MKMNLRKTNHGFTIIEVMIVLAIAALILLVVFTAVPALQRGQRNNARKSDVSRFAAATIAFYANTGKVPGCNDRQKIIDDVKDFAGYPDAITPSTACATNNAAAGGVQGGVALTTGANNPIGTTSLDALRIVTGATCDKVTTVGATLAGTSSNIALQYTLETGTSTVSSPFCQDVQ